MHTSSHGRIQRAFESQLGIEPRDDQCAGNSGHVLRWPFRYRATAADGTVENELCPVYRAVTTDAQVTVDPTEVDEAWWVPWADFAAHVDGADPLSSWGAQQVQQLSSLGPDPFAWAIGDLALLPAAALP